MPIEIKELYDHFLGFYYDLEDLGIFPLLRYYAISIYALILLIIHQNFPKK